MAWVLAQLTSLEAAAADYAGHSRQCAAAARAAAAAAVRVESAHGADSRPREGQAQPAAPPSTAAPPQL